MYTEFKHIILDYFSSAEKYWKYEWGIPTVIVLFCNLLYYEYLVDNLYDLIKEMSDLLADILGFTLAGLAIFISLNSLDDKLKNVLAKNCKIRGENPSLYQVMLVSFTYLVIVETILLLTYFVGCLFPLNNSLICQILNSLFVIVMLHLLFATIRIITNLYFSLINN